MRGKARKEKDGNDSSSKLVCVAVARDTRETLQLVAGGHQVTGSCLKAAELIPLAKHTSFRTPSTSLLVTSDLLIQR